MLNKFGLNQYLVNSKKHFIHPTKDTMIICVNLTHLVMPDISLSSHLLYIKAATSHTHKFTPLKFQQLYTFNKEQIFAMVIPISFFIWYAIHIIDVLILCSFTFNLT